MKTLTEEQVVKLAKLLVKSWEGIPAQALEFQKNWKLTDEHRMAYEEDLRSRGGGVEVYNASVEFLQGREES